MDTNESNRRTTSRLAQTKAPGTHDRSDYERRLRAAGILGAPSPSDMEALRSQMARRLNMAINTWTGCRERLCRRQRGCMAPNGDCANASPVEADPQRVAKTLKELQQAFAQRARKLGNDEADPGRFK